MLALQHFKETAIEKARLTKTNDEQSQFVALLEAIAMNVPLPDVLEHLVGFVESQFGGIIGAVLPPDETGAHLRQAAAPSLLEAYVKAVDGLPIGPNFGLSGTAACRREAVVVADIMIDPLWEDYRGWAAEPGIR